MTTKNVLVCGGGGFIGSHLVRKLKEEGCKVHAADLKFPPFSDTAADFFYRVDLRLKENVDKIFTRTSFDEVYQLAADMGGAGYIFTGNHDADVMTNSALINLHVAEAAVKCSEKMPRIFFSSSACMYPSHNQEDPNNPLCSEASAYPANPDSEYGWEKLFSERLYLAYQRNYGLPVSIGRYHNIFGPEGTWEGGKEKAPAAICRKVAEAPDGGTIEIWGDGIQTRSFLYVDECVKATIALLRSDFSGPVNIGSEEMISINDLAAMAMQIAGKSLSIKHIEGPQGVRGRNSDNRLFKEKMGWAPTLPLREGMTPTYRWIDRQVQSRTK